MEYLQDFSNLDKSKDGSLDTEELEKAYNNTEAHQTAIQAIRALGHDIDLRTYMKWRRGDFHEIERHAENENTTNIDATMRRAYTQNSNGLEKSTNFWKMSKHSSQI